MCFDLWWDFGSFVYATALVLSQYRGIRLVICGMTSSLVIKLFIHIHLFVILLTMIYSTLVTKFVTVGCLEFFQLIVPPFKVNTYHDIDLRLSKSI